MFAIVDFSIITAVGSALYLEKKIILA